MSDIDMKYAALRNKITVLKEGETKFNEISDYAIHSQKHANCIKIKNIFCLERENEVKQFRDGLHNIKLLFHGSNSMFFSSLPPFALVGLGHLVFLPHLLGGRDPGTVPGHFGSNHHFFFPFGFALMWSCSK